MNEIVVHALSLKDINKTRCGGNLRKQNGIRSRMIAGSPEYVTCKKCLINIRREKEKKEKEIKKIMGEKLMRLLGLIEIYSKADGVLRAEFEAFSGFDEPIETIDELIEVMESEMSYWETE